MGATAKDDRADGLSRERLAAAGLDVLEADGLDGLSMRAVAQRLGVKAASLYWHVRDRQELLALIAETALAAVAPPALDQRWRTSAEELCAALDATLDARPGLARLLVETSGVFEASPIGRRLLEVLRVAGLDASEAKSAVSMLLASMVLAKSSSRAASPAEPRPARRAALLIDTGSFGVTFRAGSTDGALAAAIPGPDDDASVAVAGSTVVVRRTRTHGRSEVHLDPRSVWSVRVSGGTSQIRLLLSGLHLDGLKIDSGAVGIDVVLPRPDGIVPIDISSGVSAVRLHRPRGAAAAATVSVGTFRLRLDGASTLAALSETRWSSGDPDAADRYELKVNSGTMDIRLDQRAPAGPRPPTTAPGPGERIDSAPAIELLLDGIEARVRRGPPSGVGASDPPSDR